MFEIVSIILLARIARARGRSRAWGLVVVPIDLVLVFISSFFGFGWYSSGAGGFAISLMIAGLGLLAGFLVVSNLSVPGSETLAAYCPRCGSDHAERVGTEILCYSCRGRSVVSAAGSAV